MEVYYDQIISVITKYDKLYSVHKGSNSKESYSLASIQNMIQGGVYYLTKEIFLKHKEIRNSVIINNADPRDIEVNNGNVYLFVSNPQLCFYRLCQLVEPEQQKGIHPAALIHEDAKIGKDCYIGPYSVIGKATIGDNCIVAANVVIDNNVLIGENTRIEPHSYIGATGVVWVWGNDGKRILQPQYGGVIIERNCFIGSDVSIVRGSVNENTFIGEGSVIAHGTKIGHGCHIEKLNHFANNVSLAGNVHVGERCFWGSGAVAVSQIKIGASNIIGAGAVVTKSFLEEKFLLSGVPAKIIKKIVNSIKLKGVPKNYIK